MPPFHLRTAGYTTAMSALSRTLATSFAGQGGILLCTLMAMTGGANSYPEGSLFMDCQGSELKEPETLAKNSIA